MGNVQSMIEMTHPGSDPVPDMEVVHQVRQARRGAQSAFSFLYRRFSPLVHAILLSRFPPALADELTQECFSAAFSRMDQLREEAKFGAWIAVIARRMSPGSRSEPRNDVDPDAYHCEGATPDKIADAAHVLRAIAALPEAYRETLMLRLVEGMSGQQIASLTGLTPASVRVNLHRGMARLRAALGLAPTASAELTHD